MNTRYNIGQEVVVKGKINDIKIDKDMILYRVRIPCDYNERGKPIYQYVNVVEGALRVMNNDV